MMVAMAQRGGGAPETGWSAPFAGFGTVLVGLVWFQVWSIRHRHDDD
jgi:hypothetical protein